MHVGRPGTPVDRTVGSSLWSTSECPPKRGKLTHGRTEQIDASLCQVVFRGCPGARRMGPALERALVVVLVLGPGSDLSEVPVYQGVSRPRWNQSRPWVSSRTPPIVQLRQRRASARRRR